MFLRCGLRWRAGCDAAIDFPALAPAADRLVAKRPQQQRTPLSAPRWVPPPLAKAPPTVFIAVAPTMHVACCARDAHTCCVPPRPHGRRKIGDDDEELSGSGDDAGGRAGGLAGAAAGKENAGGGRGLRLGPGAKAGGGPAPADLQSPAAPPPPAASPSQLRCIAELRDELACAVCLDVAVRPCTAPCGHSFCRRCARGQHWKHRSRN